jgi:Tfp pilus assembly protein PilP
VDVVAGASGLQIEISSSQAVTPRVSKLKSPDRVVVELPETVVASAQNKIAVGSAGVKGVRIGMDGKTPPTTSVVVDLESPLAYEIAPGADGKLILTLHTLGAPSVAKNSPASAAAPAKTAPIKSAPVAVAATKAPATAAPAPSAAVKTVAAKADPFKAAPSKAAAVKAAALPVEAKVVVAKAAAAPAGKPEVAKLDPKEAVKAAVAEKTAAAAPDDAAKSAKADAAKPKQEDKKWSLTGKRDPFFSPVVQTNGSGCSTGKKCLEINAINLRGVVKSDSGFIAVVTNSLNKAYFLRENDPVFNGYVVKITGDSVVFQETVQDKLGKPLTREVTKRIFTPAV